MSIEILSPHASNWSTHWCAAESSTSKTRNLPKEKLLCSASHLPSDHKFLGSLSAYRRCDKASRLRGATVTDSVCPYCAVGCGQLIFTKGGQLIDVEGDPESPISGGHLCPKGANAFQLTVNSHRVRNVLYRAPNSDHWETKTLDWALDQIAQRVKATRDADFTTRDEQGRLLNSVRSIGTLGGATIDNEENYLIKKLFGGGLGVVSIENQARI